MSRTFLEPGDTAYWPYLLAPSPTKMTVLDRNKVRRSNSKKSPLYHQIQYTQYLLDGLMDNLVSEMHDNVRDHWDNIIMITGAEGTGKSNLAYYLAKSYDPNFSLQDGYVYDFETMVKKLNESDIQGSVLWCDEATELLGNRDWAKEENKALIKILKMMRSLNLTIILVIPDFGGIDTYVRDQRVRYILEAKIMSWENRPEKTRGYWEFKRPKKGRDPETYGYGIFPQMAPEIAEEYERIKLSSQKKALSKLNEKINPDKKEKSRDIVAICKMAEHLHDSEGLTYDEISVITGIPASTLRRNMSKYRQGGDDED